MDFDHSHQETLDNTNKVLNDLERKLLFALNTSNQTHNSNQLNQSQALSIIINKNLQGLGKQNVQLSVLLYIKANENEFTDELFEERRAKILTKFGSNYSPLNDASNVVSPTSIPTSDEIVSPPTVQAEEGEETYTQDYDYDYEDYEDDPEATYDDDGDFFLPPLPPRLPPRRMDPDKLYGLYDFSGPDPLHCSLLRDEPVYLVNDSDNYWWLIKKLTKEERVTLDPEDDLSDEEDGKIGFVPAECLETYAERLARLNCYKNEELEKSSRDLPAGLGIDLQNVINYQSDTSPEVSKQPSLKRKSSLKNRSSASVNKNVTFEKVQLQLDDDDDDEDVDDMIVKRNLDGFLEVRRDDIASKDEAEDKRLEVLSDVYPSETPLIVHKRKKSDEVETINPTESQSVPRVEQSASTDDSAPGEQKTIKTPLLQDQEFKPPTPHPRKTYTLDPPRASTETMSIGLYSPDTPRINSTSKPFNSASTVSISPKPEDETTQLRRSLILDRLNKVTFDIQEQLSLDENDTKFPSHYYSPENLTFGAHLENDTVKSDDEEEFHQDRLPSVDSLRRELVTPLTSMNSLSGLERNKVEVDAMIPEVDEDKFDNIGRNESLRLEREQLASKESLGEYGVPVFRAREDSILTAEMQHAQQMTISYVHGKRAEPETKDRRKSRQVHDMFLPILGKFDNLAEKLAELEDLL